MSGLFRPDLLAVLLARRRAAATAASRRRGCRTRSFAWFGAVAAAERGAALTTAGRPLSRRAGVVRRRHRRRRCRSSISCIALDLEGPRDILASTLWTVFFILIFIAGVAAWLFVLAQESRRVAEEETRRQTDAADERNRGPQAHRRAVAEGQGSRRSRQPGQEPLRRRPQPRIAHAAQRHSRLRPIAGARPGDPAAARQRHQGGAPQRRASVRPDRRPARHFQDRSRPPAPHPRRGAHLATSSTRSSTCSACRRPPRASTFTIVRADAAAGRGADRREPAAPDPDQSALQRHQVHRCRRA